MGFLQCCRKLAADYNSGSQTDSIDAAIDATRFLMTWQLGPGLKSAPMTWSCITDVPSISQRII